MLQQQAGVSVLTPCLPGADEFLEAAAESVRRLADRTDVEWILVWDGPGRHTVPRGVSRVLTLPQQSGVGYARSAALRAATKPWSFPLDADDVLYPDGVLAAVELATDKKLGWVGVNRILVPSGEKTPHWHGCAEFVAGELALQWTAPFIFHPNSVLVDTAAALAVGGWPPMTTNEDLAFVLALSEETPGAMSDAVATGYRRHPGQCVADPSYAARKAEAFRHIEKELNARRARHGRDAVLAPLKPGAAFGREGKKS